MKQLKDKWVLVTGAASGIGRAVALEFASRGSNVIIADIDEQGMESAGKEVEAKGVQVKCLWTDLTSPEEVEALARRALEAAGRVDVLVNNAGICMACEVVNHELNDWEKIMAINLRAPIMLVHHLLPHMLERGSGHIVNVASLAGLISVPSLVSYSTTKFALVGFSKGLWAEVLDKGVGVTVVCPGIVRTPIIDKMPFRGFSEELRDIPDFITISPQKAARIIVKGVMKNRGRVIPSTRLTRLLWRLYWLLPGPMDFLGRKFYATWPRTPLPGQEQ